MLKIRVMKATDSEEDQDIDDNGNGINRIVYFYWGKNSKNNNPNRHSNCGDSNK